MQFATLVTGAELEDNSSNKMGKGGCLRNKGLITIGMFDTEFPPPFSREEVTLQECWFI